MHCLNCRIPLEAENELHVCRACISSIKYNAMPPFELESADAKAYSACLYEGTLKELVHLFKYKGKTVLTGILSTLMLNYIKENPEITNADLITVVPLHKKRLREREFNQSLLLANSIEKQSGIKCKNTLEKIRLTKYQNELLKTERLVNLKHAFAVRDKKDIVGKRVLLIDDVMTTGATLSECVNTILSEGANSVTCFTLARGI